MRKQSTSPLQFDGPADGMPHTRYPERPLQGYPHASLWVFRLVLFVLRVTSSDSTRTSRCRSHLARADSSSRAARRPMRDGH